MNHLLRITKKLIVDNKFFLILLAAVMVVTHVNPYAIALTFSLKLSYRLMRFYLSARLFGSKFFILIISIFFYIILLQALIIICWLVSHNASLSSAVLATFVALLSLYAVSLNRTQVQIQIPAFRWGDLSALIVVGLILCATVLLPLHNSQGSSGSSLISLINNSVDDANHIALLNDRVQFDRGLFMEATLKMLFETEAHYTILLGGIQQMQPSSKY